MKTFSQDLRKRIVQAVQTGGNQSQVARTFQVKPFDRSTLAYPVAFEAYIEQVLRPQLVSGQTVLMYNLSSHKSAKVRQVLEAKGC